MGAMDYDDFERHHGRRAAAQALLGEIDPARRSAPGWLDGELVGDAALEELYGHWLPVGFHVCLGKEPAPCAGPGLCRARCTSAYWREHSHDVARMMQRLAGELAADERLWYVTGRLHDLDYLKGPHHSCDVGSDRSHPVAIARQMLDFGMPVISVLAVLEHSPHLGLAPSSPLSHALIACDEHATMTADGRDPDYPEVPEKLVACLQTASSSIGGFVRDDMFERANAGLLALAA